MRFRLVMLFVALSVPLFAFPVFAWSLTPEQAQAWLTANAVLVMFIVGTLVKYVPALKAVPNVVIPWLNVLLGVLGYFAGPTVAHAAGAAVPTAALGITDVLVGSFVQSVLARQLYEGFGRPILERWLGRFR